MTGEASEHPLFSREGQVKHKPTQQCAAGWGAGREAVSADRRIVSAGTQIGSINEKTWNRFINLFQVFSLILPICVPADTMRRSALTASLPAPQPAAHCCVGLCFT